MTILKNDPLVKNNPQIDPAVYNRRWLRRLNRKNKTTNANQGPIIGIAIGILFAVSLIFGIKKGAKK